MASSGGAEAHLRVAAMSIALYDGLWTIPAEILLYREQKSFRRMTRACILFILIRYISILVIVISNIGFFNSSFTESSCRKFYLISPSLKALQTMVSQVIVAVRTIAVARRSRWALWAVSILFTITVGLEFFSNIWRRIPFQEPAHSVYANCTSGNVKGLKVAWVHYLAAMIYDAMCLGIATGYIYVQSRSQPGHTIDGLSKMLLKEGLLYFIFLTAANILNLCLYITDSQQAQSAGATLGYALTWIMSQRLLIHLQQFRNIVRSRERSASNTSKPPKSGFPHFIASHTEAHTVDEVELGVHVTIEENVKVDYDHDIAGGLVSQHRITTARIEKEHRRREERRKQRDEERGREDDSYDDSGNQTGKGWQVTSVGKIFSP